MYVPGFSFPFAKMAMESELVGEVSMDAGNGVVPGLTWSSGRLEATF